MSQSNMLFKCSACGAEYNVDSIACTACGGQLEAVVEASEKEDTGGKLFSSFFSNRIVSSIIVLCVAVLMLTFTFIPFARVRLMRSAQDTGINIGLNAVDIVKIAVCSCIGLTPDGLDTDGISYYGSVITVGGSDIGQSYKELVTRHLMGDIRLGTVIAAIVFLVYTVMCIILLVYGALSLISELWLSVKHPDLSTKILARATRHLWLIFLLVPAVSFAAAQVCNVGIVISAQKLFFFDYGVDIGTGAILSAAVSLLAAIFLSVHYFAKYLQNRRTAPSVIRKDIIALLLILLVMVSVFLPFGQIKLVDRGEEIMAVEKMSYTIFDLGILSIDDVSHYVTVSAYEATESMFGLATEVFKNPELKRVLSNDVFNLAIISSGRINGMFITLPLTVLCLFLLVAYALLFRAKLSSMLFDSVKVKKIKRYKIICLILSAVVLGFNIVITYLCNNSLDVALQSIISFTGAIPPVVAFICALLVFRFLRTKRSKNKQLEYEEADVSYAPYFLER